MMMTTMTSRSFIGVLLCCLSAKIEKSGHRGNQLIAGIGRQCDGVGGVGGWSLSSSRSRKKKKAQ